MTRDRLLTELRAILDVSAIDPGWTPEILLGYLAEGQDVFCEETGFFQERINYTLDTEVGTENYALDDRIIKVLDVFDGTTRLGHFGERDNTPMASNSVFPFNMTTLDSDSVSWQADSSPGYLTLWPTPTTVRTLTLRVWRYSRYALDNDDVDGEGTAAEPEIPSALQRACVEWAAYKALGHHDKELISEVDARKHKAKYDEYVMRGVRAFKRLQGISTNIAPDPTYITE